MSLGPGFSDYLIPRAQAALAEAQVVVGYQTYIDLVRPWLTTQEVVATGMKAEVKRCQLALDRAQAEKGWPWSPAATPASTVWPAWS